MNLMLMTITLSGLALAVAFLLLFRKLASNPRTLPVSVDWIRDLSAARYRPMERLLENGDFEFLASHPGTTRSMIRRLRAQRRKVFRSYLRSMERDFNRICMALEILMLQSAHDRPDLARILIRQKAQFRVGVLAVQGRLALHALGWGHVDVRGLLGAFDTLGGELRSLVPALDATAA